MHRFIVWSLVWMSGRGGNNKPFKGTFTCDTEMLFPSEADWEESLSFVPHSSLISHWGARFLFRGVGTSCGNTKEKKHTKTRDYRI